MFRNASVALVGTLVGMVAGCLLGVLGGMLAMMLGGVVMIPVAAAVGWFRPLRSDIPPGWWRVALAAVFGSLGLLFFLHTLFMAVSVLSVFCR